MSEYALYEIVEVERLREELVKTKRLFNGCAKEIDRLAGRLEQEEEMRVAAESLCEELEQQLREAEAREARMERRLKAADAYLEFCDERDQDMSNWSKEDYDEGGRLWEAYLEAKEGGGGDVL